MTRLEEPADLLPAPASSQIAPASSSSDHPVILHSAPGPVEASWPGLCVVVAAAIALLLKVVIAFNTFGTNDAVEFYRFAAALKHDGLQQIYLQQSSFNHPPLVAHYLTAIYDLDHRPFAHENGITFPFLLRFPGIVADFVVVCALLALRKREPGLRIPTWALFLLAVSPVSLMVSGYHGNTDPIMVLFLVLAACQCARHRPIWCGILFALSCQIKIVPLLCLPVFLFFWLQRRSLSSFVLPLVLTTLIFWSEPLVHYPLTFLRNVFGYGSYWGLWGVTYWLRQTGWSEFSRASFYGLSPAQNLIVNALKLTIVAAVLILAWRRRKMASGQALFASLAYTWMIFFILSPGIGAQYLVWAAPFILVFSAPFYALFTAGSTLFLFFFYNTISRGLPWYGGMSNGNFKTDWTPWSIWPWAILVVTAVLLWQQSRRDHPSLRWLNLKAFSDEHR
jgi:Gpi18-like mannosyltransferase